jgi:hypothetical protein
MRLQLPFLKNEWLSGLQSLQAKWGGKLADVSGESFDGVPHYASLTGQIGPHKVYLSRETGESLEPHLKIYLWGSWDIELSLRKEDLHDNFLKALGVEREISLGGNEFTEIDKTVFNKNFLIKGYPEEPIKALFSDARIREIVNSLEDFAVLHLEKGMLKIIYTVTSEDQIRADRLEGLVNSVIKFKEAIEASPSIPKASLPAPPPPRLAKKPLMLDFSNKKVVTGLFLVELLMLTLFGNGILNGLNNYAETKHPGELNGAILIFIIFWAPIFIATLFTARKLVVLFTISSCGITLDSTHIKPGDAVNFVAGITAYRRIMAKEIILTISNGCLAQKSDSTDYQTAKKGTPYSKKYTLAEGMGLEKKKPYFFKGQVSIPPDAFPSGVIEHGAKRSVINVIDLPEYYSETSVWTCRVDVKIAFCPDYHFEQEFRVHPKDSHAN